MPRLLMIAPPSPHTQKWIDWIDELADWDLNLLTYGEEVPDLARGGRTTTFASLIRGVRRVRAASAADVVHAHWLAGPGWVAGVAGRKPLVVSAWGSDILVHADRSRLGSLLTRHLARRVDAVTYDAEVVADALLKAGFRAETLHRVVLGPDSRQFNAEHRSTIRRDLDVPPDARVVLSPRGLADVYDPATAVAAFATAAVGDAVLLVRADENDHGGREALAAAARHYEVGDRVIPYAPVSSDKLPALYCSVDVVLSVPQSDGTSVSVLEALFCERPVVATDLPANREWLPGEFLAPVGDAAALGSRLRRVLTEPEWAEGLVRHAARNARDRADAPLQMEVVRALYERLQSGNGC